jgi:hypothetical protein
MIGSVGGLKPYPTMLFRLGSHAHGDSVVGRLRWSIEVTFEKGQAHLGLETHRQCPDQAIGHMDHSPVGLVLPCHGARPAVEPWWSYSCISDSMASQSRPTFGLSGLGASASLACSLSGALHWPTRVHAIAREAFDLLVDDPPFTGRPAKVKVKRS